MKIKVCGLTTIDQMLAVQALGIHYGGMIFYPGSKRFIGRKTDEEKNTIRSLQLNMVGVFVNSTQEEILNVVKEYGLKAVQLHGEESASFSRELMKFTKVIKVLKMNDDVDVSSLLQEYINNCDYFLFDTATEGYGGSGRQFNWLVLQHASINKPFFLSGGIGPGDAERIKNFEHPYLCGVDINSRFEISPGLKDVDLVDSFIKAIR